MWDGVFMSKNEQVEYELLQDFREGRKSRKQVAMLLNISERAVTRRVGKIREHGMAGIKHGNTGRAPVNKKSEALKEKVLNLVRETYFDFSTYHALEQLRDDHTIELSYMTLLGWCKEAGLARKKTRRKPSRARLYRERMSNEGILLQMDGSHHKFNGQDKWCLISVIDDATSNIPAGVFFDGETSWNCMKLLRKLFETRGIPQFLYTDGAGWAGGSKRTGFSQVVRACEELGVKIIKAHSAQAKGRIERSYRTIQDRLIPELRLKGIKSMTDANRYLEQVFWPEWNKRFSVEPRDPKDRYRCLKANEDLTEILCFKHLRHIRNDHTISYDGKRYHVAPGQFGSLRKKEVVVHEYEDGSFRIFYAAQLLEHSEIKMPKRRWIRTDRKRRRFPS